MRAFEHFERTLEQDCQGSAHADLCKKRATTISLSSRVLDALKDEATEHCCTPSGQLETILRERYSLHLTTATD